MRTQFEHLNFEIEVLNSSKQDEYTISVHSQVGRVRCTSRILLSEMEREEWKKWYASLPLLQREPEYKENVYDFAKSIGSRLFEAIFTDSVRTFYYESLRLARSQRKRLRIVVDFQEPTLASLPWELMYDSRNFEFVCLNTNTQLMRYLEYPHPFYPKSIKIPLSILGMISSPIDRPPLDVMYEKQIIEDIVKENRESLNLAWVQGGSWQDLQHALQLGDWNVFHFIGHSAFDSQSKQGIVYLEDRDNGGVSKHFKASEFGRLIADHESLCLAVLSAGETGTASRNNIYSGIAPTLVRRGIPAVIAMQSEVTDTIAIDFTRNFYASLAKHLSIDEAISETRKNLSRLDEEYVSWSIPIYMTHSSSGLIWNFIKEEKNMKSSIRILLLAANPNGTERLRLDEEVREIDEALLQKAEFRDKFEFKSQWAVRVSELQSHLLRFRPDIVHFSGHGSSESKIILEDNTGDAKEVPHLALSDLFGVLKKIINIKCVVLNACYSELQARAIAEHVECVIGMSNAIKDATGISFAKSFYQAIGFGLDVETAFNLGRAQINLEGLNEQDKPQLLASTCNPKEIIFVQK